jgi:hypothetical protein
MRASAPDRPSVVRHCERGDRGVRMGIPLGAVRDQISSASAVVLVQERRGPRGVVDRAAPRRALCADAVVQVADARETSAGWPSPDQHDVHPPATCTRGVVPTSGTPDRVLRAVASLVRGRGPNLESPVVEHWPEGPSRVAKVPETSTGDAQIRCRTEWRPGRLCVPSGRGTGAAEGLLCATDRQHGTPMSRRAGADLGFIAPTPDAGPADRSAPGARTREFIARPSSTRASTSGGHRRPFATMGLLGIVGVPVEDAQTPWRAGPGSSG